MLGRRSRSTAVGALSGLPGRRARTAALVARPQAVGAPRPVPTHARPSTASTGSCRTWCATWPTRRLPAASAAGTPPRGGRASIGQGAFEEEEEIAEVVASHYLAAFDAVARGRRLAQTIRGRALEMVARAGERAASLGAKRGGAARLRAGRRPRRRRGPRQEARLRERAGRLAAPAGRLAEGRERLRAGNRALRAGGRYELCRARQRRSRRHRCARGQARAGRDPLRRDLAHARGEGVERRARSHPRAARTGAGADEASASKRSSPSTAHFSSPSAWGSTRCSCRR